MKEDKVILVNEHDEITGEAGKLEAHQKGLLHRAFSVFVFNNKGEMLIQQRAFDKYHSGGLWTNACCSHPKPGEATAIAAKRRLNEEMGIDAEPLFLFSFQYKVEFENGLTENELDHIFYCIYNKNPIPDKSEVNDWKWVSSNDLPAEISVHPNKYTYWFKNLAEKVMTEVISRIK